LGGIITGPGGRDEGTARSARPPKSRKTLKGGVEEKLNGSFTQKAFRKKNILETSGKRSVETKAKVRKKGGKP